MTFSEILLISYGGLRGAVGLCLAVVVHNNPLIPERVKAVILLYTSAVAILTLIVNAPTTGYLVNYLGLTK